MTGVHLFDMVLLNKTIVKMKKINAYICGKGIFLCIVIVLFASCTKSGDVKPKKPPVVNKTQILTNAKKWVPTDYQFGSSVATLAEVTNYQSRGDDWYTFVSDGKLHSSRGEGNWQLTNNDTQLVLNITADASQEIIAQAYTTDITFNTDGTVLLIFEPNANPNLYGWVDNGGTVHHTVVMSETLAVQ